MQIWPGGDAELTDWGLNSAFADQPFLRNTGHEPTIAGVDFTVVEAATAFGDGAGRRHQQPPDGPGPRASPRAALGHQLRLAHAGIGRGVNKPTSATGC